MTDANLESIRRVVAASDFALPPDFDAFAFGDSPGMADRLAGLVGLGLKSATSWLAWASEAAGDPLPRVGAISVVLDSRGRPVAVVETTEIFVLPFDRVPPDFARDEGEGDLSLDHWQREHWAFFSRACEALGRRPALDMPVACERFRRVRRLDP